MNKYVGYCLLAALAVGATSFNAVYAGRHGHVRGEARQARKIAFERAAREDKMVVGLPVDGMAISLPKGRVLASLMIISLLTTSVAAAPWDPPYMKGAGTPPPPLHTPQQAPYVPPSHYQPGPIGGYDLNGFYQQHMLNAPYGFRR